MAYQIVSYIVDPGDQTIKVSHTFYGKTKDEAGEYRQHHIESCEYFAAAVQEGREIQKTERIDDDDLPTVETDDPEDAG